MIGAAVLLLMMLFPPMQWDYSRAGGYVVSGGFNFILDPPVRKGLPAMINISQLVVQWLAVSVATLAAFFVSNSPNEEGK